MKNCIIAFLAAGMLAATGCGNGASGSAAGAGDGNAVIEAIMARRSIRQYKDTPVEREKLQLLAECGVNAPNGMNAQAWEVRIIDSKEWIDGITEVYKAANPQMASRPGFKNMFVNGTAVIAVAAPDEEPAAKPRDLSKIRFVE